MVPNPTGYRYLPGSRWFDVAIGSPIFYPPEVFRFPPLLGLQMALISIVSPCYNEEGNVLELARRVAAEMKNKLSKYDYEHIFIDNASTDGTLDELRSLAKTDKRIKVIVNSRNFGHMRSPVHGMLQAKGDAVISIVSDLQDPPELIADFVERWENGFDVVLGIKAKSEERHIMFKFRELYYSTIQKLSEVEIHKNFTGFGLYDKKVMSSIEQMNDSYPFFRSMVSEAGFSVAKINYDQPIRIKGITKQNFYTLYDIGIHGIIHNSKIPLRIAIFGGVILAILSFVAALVYFFAKLFFWNSVEFGIAPLIIGMFFLFSVMLFFMGLIGEYIGAIYTQVMSRPLVFEAERINFDNDA